LKINIFHVRHKAQDQWIQLLSWQDEGLLSYAVDSEYSICKINYFKKQQPKPFNISIAED
jgi:hypothetical protein